MNKKIGLALLSLLWIGCGDDSVGSDPEDKSSNTDLSSGIIIETSSVASLSDAIHLSQEASSNENFSSEKKAEVIFEHPWCDEAESNCGTFTDSRDGKEYGWTKIGNQTWMSENLDYAGVKGYYVHFKDKPELRQFGKVYHIKVALGQDTLVDSLAPKGVQGICPEGWHIPAIPEWIEMFEYISVQLDKPSQIDTKDKEDGEVYYEYSKWTISKELRHFVTEKHQWNLDIAEWTPKEDGTDAFGFAGRPGGYGDVREGEFGYKFFMGMYEFAAWWTATEMYSHGRTKASTANLGHERISFGEAGDAEVASHIRCLKDD